MFTPLNLGGQPVKRLSFIEKCAMFAMIQRRFEAADIAATFEVSKRTVITLRKADIDSRHYARVIRQYYKLGHDEFVRRYLTDELETRYFELRRLRALQPRVKFELRRKQIS